MERFTFENHGTITYLVYTLADEEQVDTLSLGMLTNNAIPGLAQTTFTQLDATQYLKFNISGMVPVKQFLTGAVSRKKLLGVFSGIVGAMISAEEYMIDPSSIVLDYEHIFADEANCATVMICLPVLNRSVSQANLGMFFKSIMTNVQFNPAENNDYVGKILNYLNGAPSFSLADFRLLLDEIEKTPAGNAVGQRSPVPQNRPAQPAPEAYQQGPAAQYGQQAGFSYERGVNSQYGQPSAAPYGSEFAGQYRNSAPSSYGAGYASPYVQQPAAPYGPDAVPQPGQAPNQKPASGTKGKRSKSGAVALAAEPAVPGYDIPQQCTPTDGKAKQDQVSLFYLLQHYNKENAAAYKAQKREKEERKAASKGVKKSASAKSGKQPLGNFAVPGQPDAWDPMRQAQPQPEQVNPAPAYGSLNPSADYPNRPQQNPPMPQGQPMDFGNTTLLDEAPTDTITMNGGMVDPHLIRIKTNERINITKPMFQIGREHMSDYCVMDNGHVGRKHACIISRNGEYFLVDRGSRNGTYIGDNLIQSNLEIPLPHGSIIRLADEEFEFRLY